jgi:hypothetical protein
MLTFYVLFNASGAIKLSPTFIPKFLSKGSFQMLNFAAESTGKMPCNVFLNARQKCL